MGRVFFPQVDGAWPELDLNHQCLAWFGGSAQGVHDGDVQPDHVCFVVHCDIDPQDVFENAEEVCYETVGNYDDDTGNTRQPAKSVELSTDTMSF